MLTLGAVGTVHSSLAALLQNIGSPISRTGLHSWFTENAARFFQLCLKHILTVENEYGVIKSKILDAFEHVYIYDSSSWDVPAKLASALPGCGGSASRASCKIQVRYDYKSGQLSLLDVLPGKKNDQSYSKNLPQTLQKGDLAIFDLGYFRCETLQAIAASGAFFLCRFLNCTSVYESQDSDQPLNLLEFLRKSNRQQVELHVFVGSAKPRLELRLLCVRAPRAVANQRRTKMRKAAARKGHPRPTQESLAFCSWTLMVTNAPAKFLPRMAICLLYGIRWQIELLFKQLKSILRVHECRTTNIYRLRCELYGKIIAAIIIHCMQSRINARLWNNSKKELSFDKFYKLCHRHAINWLSWLMRFPRKARKIIAAEISSSISSCLKLHQNSRQTSLQKLHRARQAG